VKIVHDISCEILSSAHRLLDTTPPDNLVRTEWRFHVISMRLSGSELRCKSHLIISISEIFMYIECRLKPSAELSLNEHYSIIIAVLIPTCPKDY
jgi:hypothetical protein